MYLSIRQESVNLHYFITRVNWQNIGHSSEGAEPFLSIWAHHNDTSFRSGGARVNCHFPSRLDWVFSCFMIDRYINHGNPLVHYVKCMHAD